MLAPSSGLLRAGIGLKLNQIKRATQSYLRDRTDQATGTVDVLRHCRRAVRGRRHFSDRGLLGRRRRAVSLD